MSIGRRKTELAAVQPHTMHRELARHCDDRAFVAALRRDPSPHALALHRCLERTGMVLAAS
jgi:hypothetical protein